MVKKVDNKALLLGIAALALLFGGVILQKIMTFAGVVLLGVAGYYFYKNKR